MIAGDAKSRRLAVVVAAADDTDPAARLAALELENNKLRRINEALMERVESAPTSHLGAYDTFEHSVFLAEQVRERTEALNAAVAEIRQSNQALKRANDEARIAHQYLIDAVESIADAFVLYDRERRLRLFNSKFKNFWQGSGITIKPGLSQQQIKQFSEVSGLVDSYYQGLKGSEAWEKYSLLGDGKIFRLKRGSWVQMSEHQTGDGGLVVLYKDITALIENERALREKALAKKSRVLQNTLDNLSQGVVLVNQQHQLEAWNQRFAELIGLASGSLKAGQDYSQLMTASEVVDLNPASLDALGRPRELQEQVLADGRVLEIRTHPMATGEFVNTYTEITERSRSAKALAASEQRIRLITDAVPALIAYVNKGLIFEFTNRAYERWYGWERQAIVGRRLREVLTPAQLTKLEPYIRRALKGEVVRFEIDDPAADGTERFVVKSYVPHFDSQGQPQGFYVLVQDITERRRTAEELRSAYQHLEQRVEERTAELRAVNSELLQAKKEAEQANVSKTKFLAAASHDLLQPMNAARLFAASLLEHPLTDKTRQLVNALSYSLEDMESLLAALVDISKLDAGVVKPDSVSFSANDLLNNLANEYDTLAQQKGLSFRFVPCSSVIHSDSQLLARILRNFLSNAVRYCQQGGILLGCRRTAAGLSIQVWDSGIGIAKDKLREIFEEFNRLHSDSLSADKGLGLGLAIVDKMAGVLNHSVGVDSEPGRGSCFRVLVPYGSVVPCAARDAADLLPPGTEAFGGSRILVLDNDASICQAMDTLLSGWGCDVITALSVDAVKAQAGALLRGVDLMIVDYHLDNGVTGLDAIGQLQQQQRLEAPVLMITADYSKELKQRVRSLGYGLLNKPVRPAKLKAVMHHLLGSNAVSGF